MICILGKTCSGKDTILKELIKYGYQKVITYTTRPIRNGELPDVTYHYITEEDFHRKVSEGFFMEYKEYKTIEGIWYYGSALKDFTDNSNKKVIILTPDGFRDLLKSASTQHKSFYIYSDEETIKKRLLERGDNEDEAKRRLIHDNIDFEEIESVVDFIIDNNGSRKISEVALEIINSERDQEVIINKKKLFIDFDGTVVNSIKQIVNFYNEDYKYYLDYKPVHWTSVETLDFQECKCATKEEITTYFKQPRFFRNLEYMDFAYEVLNKLNSLYEIIVVSMGTTENLIGKELWLKENLPFVKFIGINFDDCDDKSRVDMSGAYFVDDNAKMLHSSNAELKIAFGDKYSWNEDWDGVRCYNWTDVEGLLEIIGS